MTSSWIVVVAGVVALLGVALTLSGLFSRRSPVAAACRLCRFDLSGSQGASVCPECGAALNPSTIVAHPYVRRRGLVALGLLLFLGSLIGGGGAWYLNAKPNLNSIKPTWWLTREAENLDAQRGGAALNELLARQTAGTLSASSLDRLLRGALARQSDPSALWLPQWGTLVESARAARLIDDQQWGEYILRGVAITPSARKKVRLGNPVIVSLTIAPRRLSDASSIATMQIARPTPEYPDPEPVFLPSVSGGGGYSSSSFPLPPCENLGPQTLRLSLRVGVSNNRSWKKADRVYDKSLDFELPVEVVPADSTLVTMIDDPAMQPRIDAAIGPPRIDAEQSTATGRLVSVMYDLKGFPVAAAFNTTYRWTSPDGTRHEFTNPGPTFQAGATGGFGWGLEIPNLDATTVDMTLTPDLKAAENDPNIEEIWGRPIEFKGVPLKPRAEVQGDPQK
jgi:hypothetical protein